MAGAKPFLYGRPNATLDAHCRSHAIATNAIFYFKQEPLRTARDLRSSAVFGNQFTQQAQVNIEDDSLSVTMANPTMGDRRNPTLAVNENVIVSPDHCFR